jgi:phosphoribosylglycinamide formyltransferase-1
MIKIVILTSHSQRHRFFFNFLSNVRDVNLLNVFIEKKDKLTVQNKKKKNLLNHILYRDQVEKDFFKLLNDIKKKNIKKKYVKSQKYYSSLNFLKTIKNLRPDLIIVFGSSIIKGKILQLYKNKIINLHLGLSPYYRGSGTNYFALVNNKPELFGSTILFMDEGIDTGKIIHQIRPKMLPEDNIHNIGNRLIIDSTIALKKIILNIKKLKNININYKSNLFEVYKRKDFTESSLIKLKKNYKKNMILKYLASKKKRDSKYPIIKQKFI